MPEQRRDLYTWMRPWLFRLSAKQAHELAMSALALPEYFPSVREVIKQACQVNDPRLRVKTMGMVFPNPLGIAGGFDKDGRRPLALEALGFGHIELGTVTAQAQAENPLPNLFRLPHDKALVNRLGFPNQGAAQLVRRLRSREQPTVPLGISIGKSRVVPMDDFDAVVDDYRTSFQLVASCADFVVVNISSPNTQNLRAIQQAERAFTLLQSLTTLRNDRHEYLPILLKVSPDMTSEEYLALLDVVLATELDGVVATNTTVKRTGLHTPAHQVDAIGTGGLSGPPLRTRAREFVRVARKQLGPQKTIIGVGGISTTEHVQAMLSAGANLCQLYTGFIYSGPLVAKRICSELLRQRSY
jgi:dihydroorotate dehydrogenase